MCIEDKKRIEDSEIYFSRSIENFRMGEQFDKEYLESLESIGKRIERVREEYSKWITNLIEEKQILKARIEGAQNVCMRLRKKSCNGHGHILYFEEGLFVCMAGNETIYCYPTCLICGESVEQTYNSRIFKEVVKIGNENAKAMYRERMKELIDEQDEEYAKLKDGYMLDKEREKIPLYEKRIQDIDAELRNYCAIFGHRKSKFSDHMYRRKYCICDCCGEVIDFEEYHQSMDNCWMEKTRKEGETL